RIGAIPEHRVGECLCGRAVMENKPLFASDIFIDPRCTWVECKMAGFRSFAALPLRSGGEVLGVIGLASDTQRDFEPQGEFLETLAGQLAASLSNARLYETARKELAERLKVEKALRLSEEHYRLLFEAESNAIFLIDNESGQILQANTAAGALYGYTPEEMLCKKNVDLSAEPDRTEHITAKTPLAPDRVVTIPLRWHRKKDGTVFPVEITGRFFVRDGRPVHIAAIRDITQRLRSETALKESEERLRLALGAADQGLYDLNVQTGEAIVSEEYARMLDYDPSEFHETNTA
ncbi:MAG: PAS domain S-box protein, partial [Proteobacteria bacterium]|nr:PAS domain S-box protein [Pseudomonadota bacterium]